MEADFPQPTEFRYVSKNSKYLDPQHKALAKKSFEQEQRIEHYYNFQSKIYDATRWSFLFGRKAVLNRLPFTEVDRFAVLEVGCGTGYNLKQLRKNFPYARLMGVDVSSKMIALTDKKLNQTKSEATLLNIPYNEATIEKLAQRPKVILFSYALTMMNPHWQELILQAKKDLTAIGYIAVVDFHYSPFTWFRNHMQGHHVRMERHLLPFLKDNFEPIYQSVDSAYFGLWQYFTFIGKLVD